MTLLPARPPRPCYKVSNTRILRVKPAHDTRQENSNLLYYLHSNTIFRLSFHIGHWTVSFAFKKLLTTFEFDYLHYSAWGDSTPTSITAQEKSQRIWSRLTRRAANSDSRPATPGTNIHPRLGRASQRCSLAGITRSCRTPRQLVFVLRHESHYVLGDIVDTSERPGQYTGSQADRQEETGWQTVRQIRRDRVLSALIPKQGRHIYLTSYRLHTFG